MRWRRLGVEVRHLLTANPALPPVALAAMAEERDKFVPQSELDSVERLAARRVFTSDELARTWAVIDSRWAVEKFNYWWPLKEGEAPCELVSFHTDWFDESKATVVREILIDCAIEQIWELRISRLGMRAECAVLGILLYRRRRLLVIAEL